MKPFITILFLGVLAVMATCQSNPKTETASTDSTATMEYDSGSAVSTTISYSAIHLCTQRLPPPPPRLNIGFSADTVFETISQKRNDTIIINKLEQVNRPYILSLTAYRWPKTNLKVTFLDGDPEVISRVTQVAKEWEKYCGIRFLFGNFPNPDISISFKYLGSWSCIGTDSQKNSPSMNFGWLIRETEQSEYERVVLHEFGHALGFVHEHQRVDAQIKWNRPAVYAYYQQPPNNWLKNDVDENIFERYNRPTSNGTSFDPNSIMMYAVPAEITENHIGIPWPFKLSEMDKQFVRTMYPLAPVP